VSRQKKQPAEPAPTSSWAAVREELAGLASRRPDVAEVVKGLTENDEAPNPDALNSVGAWRDAEGLMALHLAELVLRPRPGGVPFGEIRALLQRLEVVNSARDSAGDRRALEERQAWELDNYEMSVVHALERDEDLYLYTGASVRPILHEPTSSLLRLVEPVPPPVQGKVTRAALLDSVQKMMNSTDPDDHVRTYHRIMDERWRALSPDDRRRIRTDINRSLVFWKVAAPALAHHDRPGVLSALTFGIQLPLSDDGQETIKRSSIAKSLGNLRDAWALVMTKDPSAAQWAALLLAGSARYADVRSAILSLAGRDEWKGTPGRKANTVVSPFRVSRWSCDVCGEMFEPGDHTHDSPRAPQVAASIDEKDEDYPAYGRVMKGLPTTAQPWQRLMCGLNVEGTSCWSRGGVLTPHR